MCKSCHRQFTGDHALPYKGCQSFGYYSSHPVDAGQRDRYKGCFSDRRISIGKVLSVLVKSSYILKPGYSYYECQEIDEFWTCVQEKSNKVWLIYACDRAKGEIVAYVWEKRNLKTAKALRKKLSESGVTYTRISTDDWPSFVKAFKPGVPISSETPIPLG